MDNDPTPPPTPPANHNARRQIALQQQWLDRELNNGFDQWAGHRKYMHKVTTLYTRTVIVSALLAVILLNTVPAQATPDYRLGKNADHRQAVEIITNSLKHMP